MKKEAIGVLGGTFDPVHTGHLVVAREVRDGLNLNKVIFIPAGEPYFKAATQVTPAKHRLKMVSLALAGEPCFCISDIEIKRNGLSYTVDTIGELKDKAGPASEIYFILGWDNLTDLPRWHQPLRLISLCRLIAVPRVGCPMPDSKKLEEDLMLRNCYFFRTKVGDPYYISDSALLTGQTFGGYLDQAFIYDYINFVADINNRHVFKHGQVNSRPGTNIPFSLFTLQL